MPKLKAFKYILPVLYLLFGFIFLLISSFLKSFGFSEWASMLIFLIAFNTFFAYKHSLLKHFISTLSLAKIQYLFYGIAIGFGLVGLSHIAIGNEVKFVELSTISLKSVMITLAIVSWEELWFRGPVLDNASRVYSKLGASVVFSILFVLLHALNPNMDLLTAAPDLFFGSMLLSLAYLISKSLWLPIGIHFGNNFFGNVWTSSKDSSMNILVIAEIVCVVICLFIILKRNRNRRKT